jgi:hypothetical protein
MSWAKIWAIFLQTHLVTLPATLRSEKVKNVKNAAKIQFNDCLAWDPKVTNMNWFTNISDFKICNLHIGM